eukprot:Seg438.3 transcript_id=Seg438.3/GoldUCD/mRNA.D3Y31 product="hypothetical protein" protein_id=Seg438.3/GoldUCD/D3Y31
MVYGASFHRVYMKKAELKLNTGSIQLGYSSRVELSKGVTTAESVWEELAQSSFWRRTKKNSWGWLGPSDASADEVSILLEDTGEFDEQQSMQPDSAKEDDEDEMPNVMIRWICMMLQWCRSRYNITDAGMAFLLKLFSVILQLTLNPFFKIFPSSIYLLNKSYPLEDDVDTLIRVVCPSCNAIYSLEDSFLQQGDRKVSQKCSSLKFNTRCDAELTAVKKQARDKSTLVPYKLFMMLDPSRWLKFLFQSSEFRSLLTAPHTHTPQADTFEDVWDGELWKKFQYDPTDGTDLLCKRENIALMLNVDWVKPFKRNQYKIGVIYLSILNLPRSERMLKKWTLVVGIIPGPGEPKTHINTFLAPLIDDLLNLWRGIEIEISDIKERINCRAILFCISSDLPALRKVTQFLGHKAIKGCNKCLFSAERERDSDGQLTGRMSYFSQSQSFLKRNITTVLRQSAEYKQARTESAANAIAKKNGLRYSELHRLPYFDIVEMCAEDPMHALLLGLIKKEANILLQQDTSSDKFQFAVPLNRREELRRRIKGIQIPSDCGRIPASLADKASLDGFTAQQWLLFAIAYARPVFFGLIPNAAYECLKHLCMITEKCTAHRLLLPMLTSCGTILNIIDCFVDCMENGAFSLTNHDVSSARPRWQIWPIACILVFRF